MSVETSTAGPTSTAAVPDTTDMRLVHRVFRREFRMFPTLVRSVPSTHTLRAEQLAVHFSDMADALHHHHGSEDDLVWPKLMERARPEAELISRMQEQHHRVADLLSEANGLLGSWRATAHQSVAARLAEVTEQLSGALDEHLAEEESQVLPLIERHMSVAEWHQVGERGFAETPKDRLLFFLGALFEETTPAEQAGFLGQLPWVGRLAFRLVGRRRYQREIANIRGAVGCPTT